MPVLHNADGLVVYVIEGVDGGPSPTIMVSGTAAEAARTQNAPGSPEHHRLALRVAEEKRNQDREELGWYWAKQRRQRPDDGCAQCKRGQVDAGEPSELAAPRAFVGVPEGPVAVE